MTREQLEKQIAAVSRDIDILNEKIAETDGLFVERAKLRNKFQSLSIRLIFHRQSDTESEFKPLFVYKGKTKDLLETLRQELEKAQKYSL